jgi:hypothetical protein
VIGKDDPSKCGSASADESVCNSILSGRIQSIRVFLSKESADSLIFGRAMEDAVLDDFGK